MKLCTKCHQEKPLDDFSLSPDRKDGRSGYCKSCNARAIAKRSRFIKDVVFQKYGGYVCACCGETEPKFLTIDHINNDGASQRAKDKEHGKNLCRWLFKHNFPSGFQVLCMNCNLGKSRNAGVCPHKTSIRV